MKTENTEEFYNRMDKLFKLRETYGENSPEEEDFLDEFDMFVLTLSEEERVWVNRNDRH